MVLIELPGPAEASGYPSALYDGLYGDWRRSEFDIANHAAGGRAKARKRECWWMNFGP